MSKPVLFKVTLSRFIRETATFYVEADASIDPNNVDTEALAVAAYEAEAGDVLWAADVLSGAERGSCTAKRYEGPVDALAPWEPIAVARDTDCYIEVNFTG